MCDGSMDSVVADSLAQVLRYVETGPKVCCDYVARPALAWGRKVDLRYVRRGGLGRYA